MIRVLLLTILMLGPAAGAQIRLPQVPPLPGAIPGSLPGVGLPAVAPQPLGGLTGDVRRLEQARKVRLRLLLRRHGDVLEADPDGDPVVRGEVLAFSPADAALARARGAGFAVRRERSLGALGATIVVLQAPRGMATGRALMLLRRSDPAGTYDFNNIYTPSGAAHGSGAAGPTATGGGGAGAQATPLGLIDDGVGTAQAVFRGVAVHQHGCGGTVIPGAHGTEVASLMVGRSPRFGGAAPGASLYAADVYCGKAAGGAVDAIGAALAWLAAQRVPVINMSLVGPPNALLGQIIGGMVGRGFLIVAAVGNDGPAAPPLYPAAYPGVIGVTAVDARRDALFEAERGPQVMFAAPGADIPAAMTPDGFEIVRGTSFAAPLVAGLLAQQLRSIEKDAGGKALRQEALARAAIDALVRRAIHLGPPGRNAVFGYGLIGAGLPSPRPASVK